jgi:hypothetical protein
MDTFIAIYDEEIVGQGGDASEAIMAALESHSISYDKIADGEVFIFEKAGTGRFIVSVE